jgi:hypothetical protein
MTVMFRFEVQLIAPANGTQAATSVTTQCTKVTTTLRKQMPRTAAVTG